MSAHAPCSTSKISIINLELLSLPAPCRRKSPPSADFQGDSVRDSRRFVESFQLSRFSPGQAALLYWASTPSSCLSLFLSMNLPWLFTNGGRYLVAHRLAWQTCPFSVDRLRRWTTCLRV